MAKAVQDGDLDQAKAWAAGMQQLADLERQRQDAFFKHVKNQDRKKAEEIWEHYLELVELTNEAARRIDDGQTKPG